MRVHLNLATKALETHRKFLVASGLLTLGGGIVFLALGWHVHSVRRVDAEVRTRTEKTIAEMNLLERQRTDLENFFAEPENARLHDRAAFLNALIDARSFDWTQMFMDLERVLPGGVRVQSIEPKQDKGRVQVKLTVDTSNEDAKLKFLKALEESKVFTHVEIVKEQIPSGGGPGVVIGEQKTVELSTVYARI
jgi:type IV pilus assembly protein PilN